MLRSASVAVRSVFLLPENFRPLNYAQISRLFGTQLRLCSVQSSPDTKSNSSKDDRNSSQDDASVDQKTSEAETKATDSGEQENGSQHDRLLKEKERLLKDLQDKYKRSLADNENILSRSRKQVEEARLFGIQTFSKDLLEVADILGKATETVPKEEIEKNDSLKNLYDGLLMTEAQLQKVFRKNGLEKINPLDEKFDPYSHEALFQIPLPGKEKGTVAIVEKVGYKLHGRTLRPALVGVVTE